MDKSQRSFWGVMILLMAIVIDIMGVGLVFPILPTLFTAKDAIFLPGNVPESTRYILYGIAMGIWSFGIFLGTPFFGDLSDKIGRKKSIMWCFVGMTLAYALCAISVQYKWMFVFLAARFINGFFAGSFSIIQAAIVDISPADKKMRNIGWVTLAASFGLVFGPLISGVSTTLMNDFGYHAPFWIASGFSCLNVLGIWYIFQETYEPIPGQKIRLSKAFYAFTDIFMDKRTRLLALIFFLLQFGWGCYIQGIPVVLSDYFGVGITGISFFFLLIGLSFMAGIFVLQPLVSRHLDLDGIYVLSALITGGFLLVAVAFPTLQVQWYTVPLSAMAELLCYTGSLTLFSNAVGENEQGKVMGGTGAIIGISWMSNAAYIGVVGQAHPMYIIFTAALVVIASGVGLLFKKELSIFLKHAKKG